MTALAITDLAKAFDAVQALVDIAFEVAQGEFFCVVGPTNAGKTTLLKTIAGLHAPDRGQIMINGRDVTALQPKDRRVSLLFQNVALFPTLSGYDNIAFPLKTAGLGAQEIDGRVRAVAGVLKVEHVLDRLPRTFSGGEQQRVAIGRAIAGPSDLLMLDEPLTNLDARIRIALRIEFKKLHKETGQSLIYVTHDQVEAMSLSDRIAVLHEGRFQQIGSPDDIYNRPANRFVARFVGTLPMNFIEAEVEGAGNGPVLCGAGFRIPLSDVAGLNGNGRLPQRLGIGVRPESIRAAPSETGETPIPGDVFWVERLGSKSILDVRLDATVIKVAVPTDHPVQQEGAAWFGITPQPHHLLDLETDQFLK